MDRRDFLRRMAVLAGASSFGAEFWRQQFAFAAVLPGSGPYGALQAADANGIELPAGFTSRLIARSGVPVAPSTYVWHGAPDGGACFPVAGGGWVYASNSEILTTGGGGVGALKFDATGTVVDAYRILSGTTHNCAGGPTPWGTWLSCEENGSIGRVYECNPLAPGQGVQRPGLGSFSHEAAGVDPATGNVYLTEDDPNGRLYRFVPVTPGDLSAGSLYAAKLTGSTVTWVATSASGPDRQATTTAFNGGEGVWVHDGLLFFTTKGDGRVWELELATQTLTILYDDSTTAGGALTGVDNITVHTASGDIYVCEDGGNMEICTIAWHAGAREVTPFLRVNGQAASELTGVAFSPDGMRMYFSSQRGTGGTSADGLTYEITGPFRLVAPPTPHTLVSAGSTWSYLDVGADPGTAWRGYDFAGTWASGPAPLGYGDPVATTLAFGADPLNKPITTYFRRTFTATHGYSAMTVRLRRDDGAVVYVNGIEVARSNLPAGAVSATTPATTTVNVPDETVFVVLPVAPVLYQGENVIAVEVHQAAASSSDLVFDLELSGTGDTGPLPIRPGSNPIAAFTAVASGLTVAFDASASSDPDGTIAGYAWSFGDGTTGTGVTAIHTYAAAGTYTVALTVTDDAGATGTHTVAVTVAGPAVVLASDAFGRTVVNGFGTADMGGAWSIVGASNSFAVNSGSAAITGAVGANRSAYLTSVSTTDVDLAIDATVTDTPTGGGVYTSVIARRVAASTDYRAKLRFQGNGRVTAQLVRVVANAETVLTSLMVPDLVLAAGDTVRVRVQVTGTAPTTLRLKVWRAGTAEPSGWLSTATDTPPPSLQAPGHIGLLVFTSGSWTGARPVLRFDNLSATTSPAANAGPTAAFTSTTSGLTASFDAGTSSDTDGTIVAYAWTFGDGSTGTGITPQRTYAAAGTYSVTLTVTDEDGATATSTAPVTVTAPVTLLAADAFGRTVVNGFGTADTGGAWSHAGALAAFAVNAGSAAITSPAGGTRSAFLTGVSSSAVDLAADVTLQTAATGGGAYVSLLPRRAANGADYRAKFRYGSNGQITAQIVRTSGGETALATLVIPGLTVAPGDTLRLRVQAIGTTSTTVQAKAWRAGTAEPAGWQVAATDAAPAALQAPGHIGVVLYTSSSWTGTAPTVRIDNLTAAPALD